jgi:Ca2+/Na+ antiporter
MSSIWTKIAVVGGVLCGLGELALSPTMEGAAGIAIAVVFGLAFLVGVVRLRRGHVSGAWVIAVLALIELAFVPMYPRSSAWDWATQASFSVASAIALVGAVGVIVERRRRAGEALVTG